MIIYTLGWRICTICDSLPNLMWFSNQNSYYILNMFILPVSILRVRASQPANWPNGTRIAIGFRDEGWVVVSYMIRIWLKSDTMGYVLWWIRGYGLELGRCCTPYKTKRTTNLNSSSSYTCNKKYTTKLLNVLSYVVKILNLIKSRESNSQIFSLLCEDMGSIFKIFHLYKKWDGFYTESFKPCLWIWGL